MSKNYVESSLKRFLKRKVKVTLGLVVAFMITGTVGFADNFEEMNKNFKDAETYLKSAEGEKIKELFDNEWSSTKEGTDYKINITEDGDNIKFNLENLGINNGITLAKDKISSEIVAKIESVFNTISNKEIETEVEKKAEDNFGVVYGKNGKIILTDNTNDGILIISGKGNGQFLSGITGKDKKEISNNGMILLNDSGLLGQYTDLNSGIIKNYGIIIGGAYSQSIQSNISYAKAYNYGVLNANKQIQRINGTATGNEIYNLGYILGTGAGQYINNSAENNTAYNYGKIIAGNGQHISLGEDNTVKNYGYIEVENKENGQYIESGTGHTAENYGVIKSKDGGTDGYAVNVAAGTGEGTNYGTVIKTEGKNVFSSDVVNKGIVILEKGTAQDWNTYNLGNDNKGIVLNASHELLNDSTAFKYTGEISSQTFADENKSTAYITGTGNKITENLKDKVLGTVVKNDVSDTVFKFGEEQTENPETLTLTNTVLIGYFQKDGTLLNVGDNNLTLVGESKIVASKDDFSLTNVVGVNIDGTLKIVGNNAEVAGKITGNGKLQTIAINGDNGNYTSTVDLDEVVLQNATAEEESYLNNAGENFTEVTYSDLTTNKVTIDFQKTADGKENTITFTDNLLIKGKKDDITGKIIAIDGTATTEKNITNINFSSLDSEKVKGDILLGKGADNIKVTTNGEIYEGIIDFGEAVEGQEETFEVGVGQANADHIAETGNTFNYKVNNAEKVILTGGGWHIGKDAQFNNSVGGVDRPEMELAVTNNGKLHIEMFKGENGNVVSTSFDELIKGADIKLTTDDSSSIKYIIGKGFDLQQREYNLAKYYDISGVKNVEASVIFDVERTNEEQDVKLTIKSADDFGLGNYKGVYEAVLGRLPENDDLRNAVNDQNADDFKKMIRTAGNTAEAFYTTGYAVTKDVTDTYMSVVEDFGRKAGKGEWIAYGKYVNTDSEFDGGKASRGYDGDITGTVGMLEYGVNNTTSYGAVFGMGDTEVDINGGGKLDGDNTYFGAYVKHRTQSGIDLLGNIGFTKSELDLNLATETTVGDVDYHIITDGSSDADALTFSLKGRKDYRISDSVILQPVAGLRYSLISQDAVQSRDANFRIDEQDVTIFEGTVGGNIIKEFDISNGKLALMAGAEFVLTEVSNSDDARYTLYGQGIELTGEEDIADNRVEAHVGAEYIHENGVGVDVKYEFIWTDKGDSDRISAGVSYKF